MERGWEGARGKVRGGTSAGEARERERHATRDRRAEGIRRYNGFRGDKRCARSRVLDEKE